MLIMSNLVWAQPSSALRQNATQKKTEPCKGQTSFSSQSLIMATLDQSHWNVSYGQEDGGSTTRAKRSLTRSNCYPNRYRCRFSAQRKCRVQRWDENWSWTVFAKTKSWVRVILFTVEISPRAGKQIRNKMRAMKKTKSPKNQWSLWRP